MNYLIHTCSQRRWYVDEFLVPSMKEQGIEDDEIAIYTDEKGEGQLRSFINSYELVKGKDTWHLQDDIIISKNFKQMAEEHNNGIVCGFCNGFSNGYPGYANVWVMWYSMPCIRLPDYIFKGLVGWMNDPAIQRRYKCYFDANKHDDVFLEMYLKEFYSNMRVWNLAPNMVNHIDHLIGGSLINQDRSKPIEFIMSKYWDEPELLEDIENKLKERRTIQ